MRSIIEFDGLDDSFGRYDIWFYCTGQLSDADIFFQYQDDETYYRVSCRPTGTENPGVSLHRATAQGERQLRNVDFDMALDQWHLLTIERFCDGHTHIDVDGAPLIHDVDDVTFADRGKIRLQSWGSNTYWDELSFAPFQSAPLLGRRDTICTGDRVVIGGVSRTTSGTYRDVIRQDVLCKEEQDVALYVIPVDTIQIFDSICDGDTVEYVNRTFYEGGTFFERERVAEGCGRIFQIDIKQFGLQPVQDSFGFCPALGAQVSPGSFQTYLWEDGSTLPYQIAEGEETLTVDVVDSNFCARSLTLLVEDICPLETYTPNAFTPNGDGTNDFFTSYHNKKPDQFRLWVFDRWGNQIFETDDHQGWNGQVNGQDATPGVYLFMLEVDGQNKSGDVVLLR